MSLQENKKKRSFRNFDEAAGHILEMLSKQLKINTLFIAKNDGQTNEIVKSRNTRKELIIEGSFLPLENTFCSLSISYGEAPLVIEDISKSKMTESLEIASQFDNGSFIGIPVYYEDGEVYGTICGLDNEPFEFTEEHIYTFETMSSLLTYVLELEKANNQIQTLSSPLVPVTKGLAILPVIGEITTQRAQTIIDHVLTKAGEKDLEYLVIDVSGVSQINTAVDEYLLKLVDILKVVGIAPVITGIQPFMALKVPHFAASLKGVLIEANLETALKQLGFVLMQNCPKNSGRL
ncbi:STAS domain-containing protein [Planomicrobium sp. CPCC 101079]|uniref:STAS domain-containing protein n=1 Tax=Planomicrobium sp. CPCC 101079 TaxID=2599618 RepID=UPI0011B83604|nr:STAS domain-containing protein [Planomicrobium sp. CPCC 101079]TWT02490.1 STAS domain-containing protein [Planomicrobium sp. CPCC 101079]